MNNVNYNTKSIMLKCINKYVDNINVIYHIILCMAIEVFTFLMILIDTTSYIDIISSNITLSDDRLFKTITLTHIISSCIFFLIVVAQCIIYIKYKKISTALFIKLTMIFFGILFWMMNIIMLSQFDISITIININLVFTITYTIFSIIYCFSVYNIAIKLAEEIIDEKNTPILNNNSNDTSNQNNNSNDISNRNNNSNDISNQNNNSNIKYHNKIEICTNTDDKNTDDKNTDDKNIDNKNKEYELTNMSQFDIKFNNEKNPLRNIDDL